MADNNQNQNQNSGQNDQERTKAQKEEWAKYIEQWFDDYTE